MTSNFKKGFTRTLKNLSVSLQSKRGFTLIELLVVIAIIGILSAIVLASLNTARSRAKIAAAKSELASMRAEFEIYAGGQNSSYDNGCSIGQSPRVLFDAGAASLGFATSSYPNEVTGGSIKCRDNNISWLAAIKIDNTPKWFCVDSSGYADEYTGANPIATINGAYSCL